MRGLDGIEGELMRLASKRADSKQLVKRAGLVTFALGLRVSCWAYETHEILQRMCLDGDGGACYRLALRHQVGDGVPLDRGGAEALLRTACRARFYQACFSGCVQGLDTCNAMTDNSAELWQPMRAFLGESDAERRRQFIKTTRSLGFLGALLAYPYTEIKGMPDYQGIREEIQRRIRDLAQTDPSPVVRRWAVGDVDHDLPVELVKRIAANDPDPDVRKRAKQRLVRSMGPRWNAEDAAELARMAKSPDAETRQLAVHRIEDPALLARLAEKAPERDVREDAVDKLAEHADVSQAVLARIAESDKGQRVRSSAAALVTDQKALERLLRTSRVASVRRHALENLADKPAHQSLLLWVAENDGEEDLRQEAVTRLQDQATLARLARSSRSVALRTTATAKLQDQKLLGEIASRDNAAPVWQAAITTITDEAVLADVVRRRPDEAVLEQVARKTTDQRVLATIAKTAKRWLTRAVAIGRLTETKTLEEIAVSDAVPMVREAAKKRLEELRR